MRVAETIFEVKEHGCLQFAMPNAPKNYLADAISQMEKVVSFNIKYHVLYFAGANFENPYILLGCVPKLTALNTIYYQILALKIYSLCYVYYIFSALAVKFWHSLSIKPNH